MANDPLIQTQPAAPTQTTPDPSQFFTSPTTGTLYTSKDVAYQYEPGLKQITVGSLSPATPINLPTTTPTVNPLPGATAGADTTTKSLTDYIKELTPPPTETSKKVDDLTKQVGDLLPGLQGRGADQIQAEKDAGLPALKQRLADLNAAILTKTAEARQTDASYETLLARIENKGNVPMSLITGEQGQVRKLQLAEANAKAADLGLLQAVALGMQGQVQAAQAGVDRAIDLKYKDKESELDLKMKQLDLLKGKLSKEDEVTRAALERQYTDQQKQITEKKDKEKTNVTLAINAGVKTRFANNKSEFFDVVSGVTFPDAPSFFKAAGVTSFEDAYAKGLVSDVSQSADYSKYPASYQEYQLAKKEGFKGNYMDYQNADANRKAKAAGGTKKATAGEIKSSRQEEVAGHLDSLVGGDGYVSPEDWRTARKAWISSGYGTSASFKTAFAAYTNPADPQDYK